MVRFVVNVHRPWRQLVEAAVAVALLAVAGYVAYASGRQEVAVENALVAAERDRLERLGGHLHVENAGLRERLAVLARVRQIERAAFTEIEKSLKSQQDEVLALKQELAFYRGIVTSADPQQRLTIHSLDIQPHDPSDRSYRFQVVLTRLHKSDMVIAGSVSLSVTGEINGRPTQRSLTQMSDRQDAKINFQFKHFRKIEGRFTLPPNFLPQRVLVKVVTAEGRRSRRIERTFEWPIPVG